MIERPSRPLTRGDVLTAQMLVDPAGENCLLPGVDEDTVYRWAREGRIPSRKRGQKVFFLRFEIEAWLIADGRRETAVSDEAAEAA